MKLFDWIIILLAVLIAGFALFISLSGEEGAYVIIETPSAEYRYSLEKDRDIAVEGELGEFLLRIEDGRLRALESACPAQICVHREWISRAGDSIICVPNRIVARIVAEDEEAVDAVIE